MVKNKDINKALNQLAYKISFATMTNVEFKRGKFHFVDYCHDKWTMDLKEFLVYLGDCAEAYSEPSIEPNIKYIY